MRLALVYARIQIVELLRFPGFSIATLAFPPLLFALFGLPRADEHPELLLASYAAFAVLGVGFYQFGVSMAIERATPWAAFLRTLPASSTARLAGRALAALAFAAAAAGGIVVVALAATTATLAAGEWLRLGAALLFGGLPFVALGVAIAYWTSPKSALPTANILYVLLAFVGGLWTGPNDLPGSIAAISPYTPTRQWGDILWAAVEGRPWRVASWLVLAGYLALFTAVAMSGYRRDEGRRFR